MATIMNKMTEFSRSGLSGHRGVPRVTPRPDNINLAYGYPFPGSFPVDQLVESSKKALVEEGTKALQYGGGPSVANLRQMLATRLKRRGLQVPDEQVLVTTGSNQAIDLVAQIFVNPGDRIMVEAPTFFGALRLLQATGAEIVGIPLDGEGLDVEYLANWLKSEREAGKPDPKMFYVIPNFQNPTGTTLPLTRRQKLMELAREYDFVVLEDDAYGELFFQNRPPATLKSLDTDGRVVYTSTFSKIVAPGVRLGWAVAAPEVVAAMQQLKPDGGTGPLAQAIVYHFCEDTSLDERIAWLRSQYYERWGAMEAAFKEFFPADSTWTVPQGGFFTWLTVPGVKFRDIYSEVVANGVTYVDGWSCFPTPGGINSARMCFSFVDGPTIREGVRRMAEVVNKHR